MHSERNVLRDDVGHDAEREEPPYQARAWYEQQERCGHFRHPEAEGISLRVPVEGPHQLHAG